jgi:putative spermidine/putrescine transport system permease protein
MTAVTATSNDVVRTHDGTPLKVQLRRAERVRQLKAVGLVAPLFLFIIVSFVLPIGNMLFYSVDNPELVHTLARTAETLRNWDGTDLPGEEAYAALAADLQQAKAEKTIGEVAKRLNFEIPGIRSDVMATGRALEKIEAGPWKEVLIEIEEKAWGNLATWTVIKRATAPYTDYYFLAAVDRARDLENNIVSIPDAQAIFGKVYIRTFYISFLVTALTLLLGFPVAYLLATLPTKYSNLLMILVLLPFWTSLLVRTTAWVVLLQSEGLVNHAMIALGMISEPIQLIFNRIGTIIAMTHIQLPFTLLPIYSVMKTISPTHVRAARSLGAGPFYAFWRVYFPQTLPGIAAGCLLTFILCLGYYITPALVGGPSDQMLSYFVAFYTNQELNWGMAGALGVILLAITLVIFMIYNKLVGIDRLKLG